MSWPVTLKKLKLNFLWRSTRPSRTNTLKKYPLHYRELECKSRKSRNTWSNRQIWPWSTEEAGQRLIEFCQENALVKANTLFQQHKRTLHMDITRWSTIKLDWLCSFQPKMRSSVQSAKTKPGADCGSDYELLIAKFRLKMKKVGKTARPFRYDPNQILN